MKREDLNHPVVSGNKWWKLKYNLREAQQLGKKTLLTFGGAYSNHLYATAGAAKELGLESIGIVRGEETLPLNKTLTFATACGMKLHYVSREDYRRKLHDEFIQSLYEKFGDFYLIPEGGTNELAVNGIKEFAIEHLPHNYDFVCCAVGTGGTMAGLIQGLGDKSSVLGFSVLKGGEFLEEEVNHFLVMDKKFTNWLIKYDYHFGGYAKCDKDLIRFIEDFKTQHDIPLDHVYTGKMMAGVYDLIKKDFFLKGSKILALHSGGLQGKH